MFVWEAIDILIIISCLSITLLEELIDCESVAQLITMAATVVSWMTHGLCFEYIVKNGGLRKKDDYPYSMEWKKELARHKRFLCNCEKGLN